VVSEYLESEFLAPMPYAQRVFLTRSAVLERMCGPLCDAVLGQSGSAAVLADLAQSNLLLVLLDRWGEWYRYHHLFRDMLRAELHRSDPNLVPILRRRAVSWCLQNGLAEGRWSTPSRAGTSTPSRSWRRDSGYWPTGKAGSQPCVGGSAGWKSGAGTRDTR
jgi:hypothetical protein